MTINTPDIAIIIVNYGTADLTIAAIESVLKRQHGGRTVHVHVVDNASPNDDASRLTDAYENLGWQMRVTLHLETDNHGFGRGNNVVFQALALEDNPPEFVFLLNPDAQLENEAIDLLANALTEDRKAGAAGAALTTDDGEPLSGAFRYPTLISEWVRIANFGPLSKRMAQHSTPLPPEHPSGVVDWVSGAAVMFRFSALRDVGFFDPAFFLYYEEVELMLRLNREQWHTLFVPEAQVVHIEAAATGRGAPGRRRQPSYLYHSWRHYFTRSYGPIGALGVALCVVPAAGFNWIQRRLRGQTPNIPKHYFGDHLRQVIWPLLKGQSAS